MIVDLKIRNIVGIDICLIPLVGKRYLVTDFSKRYTKIGTLTKRNLSSRINNCMILSVFIQALNLLHIEVIHIMSHFLNVRSIVSFFID